MQHQAAQWISSDPDLAAHLDLITLCMDAIWKFVGQAGCELEHGAVGLLGRRVFNDLAASLRLLFGGYFQVAGMALRDIYETSWLITYLSLHPQELPRWQTATTYNEKQRFSPKRIRDALDRRDGFPDNHRSKIYWELCDLAAHPTLDGLSLLGPPGRAPECGPFMEHEAVHRTMESIVSAAYIGASNIAVSLRKDDTHDHAVGRLHLEIRRWQHRFIDVPFSREQEEEIRAVFGLQ